MDGVDNAEIVEIVFPLPGRWRFSTSGSGSSWPEHAGLDAGAAMGTRPLMKNYRANGNGRPSRVKMVAMLFDIHALWLPSSSGRSGKTIDAAALLSAEAVTSAACREQNRPFARNFMMPSAPALPPAASSA